MEKNKKDSIDVNIFKSLFGNSLSGILYGNPDDGNIYDSNQAAADMFGYTIEELNQLNRNDIFDFKHISMIHSLKKRSENGSAKGELVGVRKNGERFPCEFTSSIFKNKDDENRTCTILNDISERKKSEEEIALLLDNTEESFVLIDEDLNIVSFNKKFKENYLFYFKKSVEKGHNIINYAQPERLNLIKEIYKKVLSGETIENEMAIEMPENNTLYYLNLYKPAKDSYGNIIGVFFTSRNITVKKNALHQTEIEQRNREALINSTEDLLWSVDKDFKLIAGNRPFINTMKKTSGLDLKPGDNLLLKEYYNEDFVNKWEVLYKKAMDGERFKIEMYSPDMPHIKRVCLETSLNPIYDGNDIVGVACYSRDITRTKDNFEELRLSKEEIIKNHEQLSNLTDSIDTIVFQFEMDSSGKMTFPFVSKSVKKIIHDIDIDLLKTDGTYAFKFVHPDDKEILIKSIIHSKDSMTDWRHEYRMILNSGSVIWIKGASHPTLKEDGRVVWYGYLLDITDRKINEDKLRISNERYDIIAKATNDTIWDIDVLNNTIVWNKGIKGIYGYCESEPNINNPNWWYTKIHPDDIERVKQASDKWIKSKTPRFEIEYRFLCADNTYKYIHDRAFQVLDDNNNIIRLIGAMQDITERKLAEERYYESELRFKKIFEAEPECVKLVDATGKLVEMNKAGLEMLETDSIEEVNRLGLFNFILPKYREAYIALYQNVMSGNEGYLEYEAVGYNGTKRWMETNAVPVRNLSGSVDLMLSVTHDITQRKKEEHHLKLLESVITNTNDSVMITEAEPFDEPGPRIVYVNEAFSKMTGYTKEEVLGKSPRFLQGPNTDKHELKRLSEDMRKWKTCETTIINYKKNGEEFWVNFSIKPVADDTGWYTHWIAVERDVTQQKKYEQEREQMVSELSQNIKDLKHFSYVTSHNLRAPIANLLGLTSLIDQYKVNSKSLKQILDGIKQSALMFDDTVKDLTQVLVIKDQTNIVKEDVLFNVVIENVLKQLSISLNDNEIKIDYNFQNAPKVSFTNTYLESILLNLFTNSIKYKSHKRKLKINIISKKIDNNIELRFTDNGIGIDVKKYKDKIFKLYQRFHDNPDGKGLGLYLIKSQIEALGGTIDIDSTVNVGTTFILKFKDY